MTSVLERNKALIRELLACMDAGRLDAFERFYAPDYVDRSPTRLRGGPPGPARLRGAFDQVATAFPDTVHVIDDLIAEGDRVAARITARGTFANPLFGHPPTGEVVEMSSVVIYRIAEGRIIERWASGQGLLEILGIPEPGR